jgi:signal transduction histidine kinase
MPDHSGDTTQGPTLEELRALVKKQAAALADQGARMRNILHSIPLGLLVANRQQRIETINTLGRQLLEYDEPRELKGQKISVVFPELERLVPSPEPLRTMALKKSGEKVPVEIYLNEWQDDLVFAHLLDITERHRLERLRQDFLAMVSHDLRTPLSSMGLFLQMVNNGNFGEISDKFKSGIRRAENSIDLMVSLVNDLLDSEQIDSGDFQLDIQPTTTQKIVDKAIDSSQGAAKTNQVILEKDITNDALHADEDRVVRVICNLVGNAIKFSPSGGTVTVHAGLQGTNVLFRVRDQGPGVPEHLRSAIFERYKQLEQPKETKRRGVGLGLSICKALVEKHKGNIWVESTPGKGSTFCFTIPMDV